MESRRQEDYVSSAGVNSVGVRGGGPGRLAAGCCGTNDDKRPRTPTATCKLHEYGDAGDKSMSLEAADSGS